MKKQKKKAEEMILVNLVSIILVIIIIVSFSSCAFRYFSLGEKKGLDEFKELQQRMNEIPGGNIRPKMTYIDPDSAIVFWNMNTETILLEFGSSEKTTIEFPRPNLCQDVKRACVCYLYDYDVEEKEAKKYDCFYHEGYFVGSKRLPVEIWKAEGQLPENVKQEDLPAEGYEDIENIFSMQGDGVVFDRGLTNTLSKNERELMFYKHRPNDDGLDNIFICYDPQSCVDYQNAILGQSQRVDTSE